jgi:hypothetical protein
MATALPPSSTDKPGVETVYRKPRADLYTLMLIIALLAILVGILFLVFENQTDYDWKMKDSSIVTSMITLGRGIGPWISGFLG